MAKDIYRYGNRWGILARWHSFWIGVHWSPDNRRFCINLVPFITVWITLKGGFAPGHVYVVNKE